MLIKREKREKYECWFLFPGVLRSTSRMRWLSSFTSWASLNFVSAAKILIARNVLTTSHPLTDLTRVAMPCRSQPLFAAAPDAYVLPCLILFARNFAARTWSNWSSRSQWGVNEMERLDGRRNVLVKDCFCWLRNCSIPTVRLNLLQLILSKNFV